MLEITNGDDFPSLQKSIAALLLRSMEQFNVYFMLRIFQKLLFHINPLRVQVQQKGMTVGM